MKVVTTYFVFLITLVSLGAVKFRCDYKYSHAGWIKYHVLPAVWRDARLRCRHEGAMLASPTSHAIRAAMMNTMRNEDIFTGIHASVSPGDYYSIDGKPLDTITHRWVDNEPDNKDNAERCISMNSEGFFSDVRCDVPRPYMCYRADSLVGANICGTTDPEYHFETRTNKCYKFHKIPRQYKRAHLVCAAEGGHLAIINSLDESYVLRDLFAKYPAATIQGSNIWRDVAYIGFHTYGESQDFTTLHGQSLTEAGYDKFSSGEPNNSTEGEYCGGIYRSAQLDDLWCEKHFAFICEKSADYPPLCESDNFDEENNV